MHTLQWCSCLTGVVESWSDRVDDHVAGLLTGIQETWRRLEELDDYLQWMNKLEALMPAKPALDAFFDVVGPMFEWTKKIREFLAKDIVLQMPG